ncbi:Cleavage polyadenylation factor subunit clp1 [Tulasnella sp. 403]|nr:Cleavage polyadenylation factor subunit clp1 [Tulasnella sp. 403]
MERSIQNLAKAVKQRMDLDPLAQNSGLYIDTPSTFATPQRVGSELRYPFIEHCVVQFDVNVIIVIGHEKLNVDIQRLFGSSSRKINIIKVAKSGGVVDLDWQYRSRLLSYQIRAYFYGPLLHVPSWIDQSTLGGETSADLTLSPYSSPIKFNEIKILRIGAESMAPSSALPIGATRVITELEPTSVDLRSPGLLNTLLALMPIQPNQTAGAIKAEDEYSNDELITSDVAGFVLVTAVDAAKDKLTILSPNPGSLIGRTAIIGSLEWQDQ